MKNTACVERETKTTRAERPHLKTFESFATQMDANYPNGQQYYDKMRVLTGKFKQGTLVTYCILHTADNIIDSPEHSQEEKRAQYTKFRHEFNTYVVGKAPIPDDVEYKRLWHQCQEVWTAYSISDDTPYQKLFDILEKILDWPDQPFFPSQFELFEFNQRMFWPIIKIFSPVFFERHHKLLHHSTLSALEHDFFHLMMAMQYINILMDVKEDAQVGQYWLPIEDISLEQPDRLTLPTFRKYYGIGRNHLNVIQFLFDDKWVHPQICFFLRGLRNIFYTLGLYLEEKLYEQEIRS